jgi:hypothetical protein
VKLQGWRHWPQVAIGLGIGVICLPSLVLVYGLKDDYTYLAAAHGYRYAGVGEPTSSVRLGRPLFGLLTGGLYGLLPGVGWLWVARALAVAGLILFALVLNRALLQLVGSKLLAALLALLIASMPPFLVYAGWATLFCAPYSAALGGLGAIAAARASEGPVEGRIRWLALGVLLFLAALAMYQPSAMAFWLVALILALSRRHSAESLNRLLRSIVLVGVPAMLGGYLMLKIGVWTLGAANAQRAGLLSNIPAKLHWIPQPLGLALNLFNMPQSTVFGALVAVAVVGGALLFCRDCRGGTRAIVLALIVITVPLSFAPNLLSQENYATFRTVGPLTATFALLVALIFVTIERDGTGAWRRWTARGGLLVLTALALVLGFNHLRTLIALPQSREWQKTLRQAALLPRGARTIGVIAPTLDGGPITTHYGVRDEFGVPTSASTWADPSLAWLASRQVGRTSGDDLNVVVSVANRGDLRPNVPYLQMDDLSTLR